MDDPEGSYKNPKPLPLDSSSSDPRDENVRARSYYRGI